MPRKKQERPAPKSSDAAPEMSQTTSSQRQPGSRRNKSSVAGENTPTTSPPSVNASSSKASRPKAKSKASPVELAEVAVVETPPETTRRKASAKAAPIAKEMSDANAPTPKTPKPGKSRGKAAKLQEPEPSPEAVSEVSAAPAPPSARRGRKAQTSEPVASAAPDRNKPSKNKKARTPQRKRNTAEVAAPLLDELPAIPDPATPAAQPTATLPRPRKGRSKKTPAPEPLAALPITPSGESEGEMESGASPLLGTDEQAAPGKSRNGKRERKPRVAAQTADVQQEEAQPEPQAPSSAHTVSPEARELIIEQLRKLGRPVHVRDFERTFTRQGREKLGVRRDLAGLLEDLTRSGDVICTRRHTYGLPEAMNLVRGKFQASSAGFGFVIPDSGGDDFYIRENETLEAWNGDIVLIRPEGRSGGNERSDYQAGRGRGSRRDSSPRAAVVRIVSRAYSQLVGTLDHQQTYAFLRPDDHRARHRIMLMPDGTEGLPNGARVVTKLFWPEDTGEDEVYGEIIRVLGQEDDPATETQAVIVKYGLRDEFPENVVQEAERIPRTVSALSLKGRLDLRDYHIFTVDGSDAKDFDDAIHIQATPEGTFVVGVHIADVSHYVTPGSAIDEEAYARATSVYLPGQVLPMLPEHLSNGVCSLVEGEDRLTISAMIELSGDGEMLRSTFTPSVIRSKARLTYDEVQAYSEATATLQGSARILEGDLHLLLKITAKLRQKRLREGSLDFKLREVKVDVDKDGHMQLIPLREETARGMIEDLMLLANKAVAHFLLEKNVPTLFRIHEEPTMARFQDVTGAIGRMGLAFPGGEPTPQAYQAVLKAVRGTGQESAVNTLLLRSMQQAKYAGENLGHFGLAFDEYLHFTSPIRRYPDLLVHRALKEALSGPVSDKKRDDLAAPLLEQGRHTSERERTAAEAERDLTKYYQAKWAQEHLGESFEGRVTGVIASGLFVALENGVEGRLHISNLDDDYYFYIEEASILKGRTSGRIYRIGESIEVTIASVNPLARQIDYTQENSMDGTDNKPRARRREDRQSQKREKLSSFLPHKDGDSAAEALPKQGESAQQGQQQQFQRRENSSRPNSERAQRPNAQAQNPASQNGQAQNSQPRSPSGYRRRVITLDRPRNEHLRPVNVTVQRMYFGDWTLDNMPPEDAQGERERGGSFRGSRGQPGRGGPRRNENANAQQSGQSRRLQQSQAAQAQPTQAAGDAGDEARRRRRRRGRRGGSGQSGGGQGQS